MMTKRIFSISFTLIFSAAIICHVSIAKAMIPMPFMDIGDIQASVQSTMQQVQEMQQEVQQVKKVVEETINGGCLAAVKGLFGEIQNGNFDRFGQNLKGFGGNLGKIGNTLGVTKPMTQEQKEAENERALEKAREKAVRRRVKELMREDGNLTEEAARSKAESEYAGKTLEELKEENLAASKLNRTYRWLQSSSTPSQGLDAAEDVQKGNWGKILSSTTITDGN